MHSSRYYSEHINRDKVSFSIESRVLWQCQIWFISFRREWQKSRHRRHYFTYIHSSDKKKKNYVDLANISLCFYVKLLTKNIWSRWEKNTYIRVIIYCLISQVWVKGTPNIVPHKRIRNNQVPNYHNELNITMHIYSNPHFIKLSPQWSTYNVK